MHVIWHDGERIEVVLLLVTKMDGFRYECRYAFVGESARARGWIIEQPVEVREVRCIELELVCLPIILTFTCVHALPFCFTLFSQPLDDFDWQ